ncbi:MAG: oligosaccharide repeat unit polymerase [Sulfurihydrogenibium sp.]|jgi:oligosaccharide repeat unit polymerase|nr:oligosaccharide repeat unit polymerase [Sulfurihydrogenibium sp.]
MSWFLSLMLAVMLLLIAIIARIHEKSWFAPGAFFALMWSVYTLAPILISPNYYVSPMAVLLIILFVCSIFFGSVVGYSLNSKNKQIDKRIILERFLSKQSKKLLLFFVIICNIFGYITVAITLHSVGLGYNPLNIFDIELLAKTANAVSTARYTEEFDIPFLGRVLSSFIYAGGAFSGISFVMLKSRYYKIIILVFSFLPSLFITILLTTKAMFLVTLIFAISAWLAAQVILNGRNAKLFTRGRVLLMFFASLVFYIFFTIVMFFRAGKYGSFIYDKLRIAALGHIGAFSEWIDEFDEVSLSWGKYSFAGIFNLLGLHKRELGIFTEKVDIGDPSGELTNVYTAFRPFIEDFSFVGATLILFIIGVIAGKAYKDLLQGKIGSLFILIFFYVFTLWSPVTWILNYNSIILAILILSCYSMLLYHRIFKKRQSEV